MNIKLVFGIDIPKKVKRQSRKYKIPTTKAFKNKKKYNRKTKWTTKLHMD